MTDTPNPSQSRNRYLLIVGTRLIGAAGAVFGLVLTARFPQWQMKVLGGAIVLSAIYMTLVVPLALAHRWATPGTVRTNRRRPRKLPK
ncbi:MAG: hypothetical protein E7773_02860 [Sphingomonas sp.]|uniref:hypothetical protein n=1 Tax=Sphingomonas sp. TaxID=28214 RepID=UPI001215A310|nr:hypothetical protein [Sphingomonas sp.]THD37934.1 MAG: hypothetical protein E7773_02860 [Sphingomonas sp.]